MKKSVWALLVLLVVVVGLSVACHFSLPLKIAVGNGIKAIGRGIVIQFTNFTYMLLRHRYAPIFLWVVMPLTGGIIFSIVTRYVTMGTVRNFLARKKAEEEAEYQKELTPTPPLSLQPTPAAKNPPSPPPPAPKTEEAAEPVAEV